MGHSLLVKAKTGFYRTMHFSAKHGIAIVYCLSVRLSVRPWRLGTVIT